VSQLLILPIEEMIMSAWKYIVLEVKSDQMAIEVPLIFPSILTHSLVAEAVKCNCFPRGARGGVVVASAGMIGSVLVSRLDGRSESLDIESRAIDAQLINSYHMTRGLMFR
jgi:hypothetical protein